MGYSVEPATIAVVYLTGRRIEMEAYGSRKGLVQHLITNTSLAGAWGDSAHLVALRETKELLEHIIAGIDAEENEEPL